MKDRTLKNQKKHINKTLKQFRLAKRLIPAFHYRYSFSDHCQPELLFFAPGFFFPGHKKTHDPLFPLYRLPVARNFMNWKTFLKSRPSQNQKSKNNRTSEDTSRTQGIPDTSSVTANTSPVILGKAENLHMELRRDQMAILMMLHPGYQYGTDVLL